MEHLSFWTVGIAWLKQMQDEKNGDKKAVEKIELVNLSSKTHTKLFKLNLLILFLAILYYYIFPHNNWVKKGKK